jgi:hypothetical protein
MKGTKTKGGQRGKERKGDTKGKCLSSRLCFNFKSFLTDDFEKRGASVWRAGGEKKMAK